MMPTETAEDPDPKCLDLPHKSVGLGAPLVRRECNAQQLSNNENTQAFYFIRVQVTGHPEITNRYFMKPAHQGPNLCIYSAGPSMENGGNVVVGQCSSADSKQLNLRAYTGGTQAAPWDNFVTLSFQHSQRCLTVPGAWEGEYVAITQYGTTYSPYCEGLYNNQKLRILTQ